jgi:hypothetical protein
MEHAKYLLPGFAAIAAFPAAAQDLTGTLQTQGTVMVSTGGDFVQAVDGQPVAAGMRLMVGEDGSATVEYGPDCRRSYTEAGTYTLVPARCGDNDRKQDDESRREDAREHAPEQPGQGAIAGGNGSLAAQLGIIAGATVAGAVAIEQSGDPVEPDHPVSR